MNKFFTKIAALSVGLAMAIGVGVAVGAKKKEVAMASATDVSQTWQNSDSTLTTSNVTNVTQQGTVGTSNGYLLITASKTAVIDVDLSAANQQIPNTDVTIRLSVATYGSGGSVSLSGSAVGKEDGSTWTGNSLTGNNPSNSTYVTKTMTMSKPANPTKLTGIRFSLTIGTKQIRLKSISVSFSYEAKTLNHISAAATNPLGWYAGDTFSTSDVTVTPYYSSDDSDPGAPITNGTGVKFGDSANLDSVELSQGSNTIKVNYGGKSTTFALTAAAARTLSSIAVTTAPTKTTYNAGESFDKTGMVVTATYSDASTTDVTNSCTFTPSGALTAGTSSVTISCTIKGVTKTTTQAITVLAVPTSFTINGSSTTGTSKWKPTSSGSTFTDSAGNTATLTTDVPSTGFSGDNSNWLQIGKNGNAGTYVKISIPLSARAGVTAASIEYSSNGGSTVECLIYGDTKNDVILSTSVTGSNLATKSTTDSGVDYSTINASTINYEISISVGCKIGRVSYTLGETVQEFSIFTSLAIQNPTSDTQFKEGDTFSASGLVLRATDEVGFTKDFKNGLKFGTEQGDNSYTGATLDTAGNYTVYVTLTIKHPTSGADITKSVTYGITVTEVPTYTLVSDYSVLYEGAKVLIVDPVSAKGASSYGATYLTAASVTFTDGNVTDAGDAIEFTVRIYGNRFALQFGSYYLSYSGSNNQIQRVNVLSDSCAFLKNDTGILSNENGRYLEYCSSLSPAGFACVSSNYGAHVSLYISDKAPETDVLAADTFTYRYLHMRDYLGSEGQPGPGYCKNTGEGDGKNYFADAATAYASLSSTVKTEFKKNTEAVKRFNAWAAANQKSIDLDTGDVTPVSGSRMIFDSILENSSNATIIIVVISIVSLTAVGGYFLLKKKKEQ